MAFGEYLSQGARWDVRMTCLFLSVTQGLSFMPDKTSIARYLNAQVAWTLAL